MRFLRRLAAVLALCVAAPASAEWHEAQSEHFIIYSNESPAKLQEIATRLERFDKAVRARMRMLDPPVGDGNRLTVFILPNEAEVRKLAGDKTGFVAGFYKGLATGPLAFVPRRMDSGPAGGDFGFETIFFHEYAHHLMLQQLSQPYPEWLTEGFAEFMSTAKMERDGSVGLGIPPQHRAYGLLRGKMLPLEALLGGTYSNISKEERESIYGRGWLLTHYLTFEPKRTGQMVRYLDGIAAGMAPIESARAAFGDLKQLEISLSNYLQRSRLSYFKLSGASLAPGPIQVRQMSPGAAAIVLHRARLKNGIKAEEGESFAATVRSIQARHTGDELVELTLAEAELKAKKFEAAAAAADRAIKANPKSTEALILKGQALIERANQDGGDDRKAGGMLYEEARKLFVAANKIDPEDPEPLLNYYRAYLYQGKRPTQNALAALHYASNLAPQDFGVRMDSAIAYLNTDQLKDARATLVPVAYSPHAGNAAEAAKRMIAKIDSGADGRAAIQAISAAD